MFFSVASLAAVLATGAQAHMIMTAPIPMGASDLNNSPLDGSGSDFPCKLRANAYNDDGAINKMALGSTQPLKFKGGATHGGGSCQISISYDPKPSASSVFKVIHSIEGGCPARGAEGNIGADANAADPDTYSFVIPAGLPAGTVTLAWTWFNKVGNREMYMNCARVELTGSSSKRDTIEARELESRDQAFFSSLPDMFVANVGNGCGTQDSKDVKFPQPGDSLENLGAATPAALAAPTGNCQAVKAGSSSGSTNGAANNAGAAAAAVVTSAPKAAAGVTAPVNSGAIFVTVSGTGAAAAAAATTAVAAGTPAAGTAAAAAPTAVTPSTGGSASLLTGACTPEGQWNCINAGTAFQRCASGSWSVSMAVAAGTICSPVGLSSGITIEHAPRAKAHRHRRHMHPRRHIEVSS